MYEIYVIKEGDTIDKVAEMYGTSVGIINQINGFDIGYRLVPGNSIIVPIMKRQPYKYYTVKKGDNVYEIAKNNGIDYMMLLKLNGLEKDDYIYPNQTIMLPREGLDIYLTRDNDTINTVLKMLNVDLDELIRENDNIYLRPEQILVFRKK